MAPTFQDSTWSPAYNSNVSSRYDVGVSGFDVVGIGNALVDVIVHQADEFLVNNDLEKGSMMLIDADRAVSLYSKMGSGIEMSGGSAANTMTGVSSFGGRACYVGKIKADDLGNVFVHDLRAMGVAFPSPPSALDEPTGRCLVVVTPDAERTMSTFLGMSSLLGPDDIDPDVISAGKVLYMEGYLWDRPEAKDAYRKAARIAHAAGRLVSLSLSDSFCVERHRADFRALVCDEVDLLFGNEDELLGLYQVSSFDEAVACVRADCQMAAITRGEGGSVIITADDIIEVAAEPVAKVIDTTGAGDLYAGGFLYGLTQGFPLSECGRLGSIAAAEVISHVGARPLVELSKLAGVSTIASHRAAAAEWLTVDPDPVTRAELSSLMRGPDAALAARFAGRLEFGTAGLRGPLGAGPLCMNRVVVQRAAQALARWLLGRGLGHLGIAVGYDARVNSDVFALDTARVMAANGIRTYLLPALLPTPVLAFAVTHLGAAAGVMVTASHNPPADNGYKVFLADGSQIVPPVDAEIAALIVEHGEVHMAAPDHALINHLDNDIVEAYLSTITTVRRRPDLDASSLSIAYTALHGVGADTLARAFRVAGLPQPTSVVAQHVPDGAFPTVSFPNPEEPGSMDLLLALAAEIGADIALANDPDADRLGVAIPTRAGIWRKLKGDEIGWLLAEHSLQHTSGENRLVVTTLVSSSLLSKMAASYGVACAETFTGFKWIGHTRRTHPSSQFVIGYEQALGYLVADVPNDKDGISAAVLMVEVAALARADGTTLEDRLADIEARFGKHVISERSLRLEPAVGSARVAALLATPPTTLAGHPVTSVENYPEAGLVRFWCGPHTRLQVRPSGTEPKVKLYAEVIDGDPEPFLDDLMALLGLATCP